MSNNYSNFISVFPRLLRVSGESREITIHCRQEHARKVLGTVQEIRVFSVFGPVSGYGGWITNTPPSPFRRLDNGDIAVSIATPDEGEYAICTGRKLEDGSFSEILTFSVYALHDDLLRLVPLKGDFHMHSNCSDGLESPEYVAATSRKNGMDFMALTDHRRYEPSLIAIKAMRDFGCDMLCCPGEEVHLQDNPVHIINFGGKSSVNALAYDDEAKYRAEVAEYQKGIPEKYDPPTRFQVAASEWAFDRIREAGGVAMFCHPFWRPRHHNYIGEDVIDLLLEHNRYDVLEVIGGYSRKNTEENMLAVARWQEEIAKGKAIPVAGVSDSHNCDGELAGWYYTIVFAKELGFESIAEAIRTNSCVAVHDIPGTYPLVVGPFRLTRLAYFLLREFYPEHNELCRIEGEIMRRAIAGEEPDVHGDMAGRHGAVGRFMAKCREV